MVERIECQAIINGKLFDPNKINIPHGFRNFKNYRKGDIIKFGRYKGKIANEACLIISGEIDEMLEFIILNFKTSLENRDIEINLCILVQYSLQCNFELDPHQLLKLGSLNIAVGFTCYEST